MSWLDGFAGDSPAAQLFAAVLVGVLFLRLLRYFLRMIGLGS